ncbi:HNH endonuclease signature motif containing protein [Tsukamurella serpentis]
MDSCSAQQYLEALDRFERAAEALADADPVMLSSQQVLESLRRLETAARKVPYGQNLLTQVAVEQYLPGELGYTGAKELLVDQLRLSGVEARDRIRGARSRVPRHLRGVAPEPSYRLISAAQREGRISDRHAVVMELVLDKCRRLSTTRFDDLEAVLVQAAADVPPEDIALIGKRALALLDPDGCEPDADRISRARELVVAGQGDDLMSGFGGALTPEGRALLDVVLEKFARPGVGNPDDAEAPVDPSDADAVRRAAERDQRTAAQRNHDALLHALRVAIGAGLGSHRGLPCVPIVTLNIDQLESETGIATTATGGRLPVADALRMMGANPRYVLLLDLQSRPLFLGREKRLAAADQRIALYGAEQGCSAPGCDAPATRCQVHHVTEWVDGGATDVTALTLACDAHHGKVVPDLAENPRGWETITVPAEQRYAGRTAWRRGADPSGRYRVNHRHHADELYREALELWRQRHERFRRQWLQEDLRREYAQVIGDTYAEIARILDGPHGPPQLESLLAEHDAETGWCEPPGVSTAA